MRFDERMLRLIAAALPAARRGPRLEEWLADLDGAAELGLSRGSVVRGALRLSLDERSPSRAIRRMRPRTWLIGGAATLGIVVLGVPTVAIGSTIVDNARGVVTVETAADGTEQTVLWRDYPGVGGVDPAEALAGPTAEEGVRLGEAITAEIRDALDLGWTEEGALQLVPTENRYGGVSALVVVNAPGWRSTTAPDDEKRAVGAVQGILDRYGFGAPLLVDDAPGVRSGMSAGPSGQWVSFRWAPDGVSLSYGANALLPAADRAEFERRLAPFRGFEQPAPLES